MPSPDVSERFEMPCILRQSIVLGLWAVTFCDRVLRLTAVSQSEYSARLLMYEGSGSCGRLMRVCMGEVWSQVMHLDMSRTICAD